MFLQSSGLKSRGPVPHRFRSADWDTHQCDGGAEPKADDAVQVSCSDGPGRGDDSLHGRSRRADHADGRVEMSGTGSVAAGPDRSRAGFPAAESGSGAVSPMGAKPGRLLPVTGIITGVVWAGTQIVADLLFVGDPDPVDDPVGTQQALLDHQVAAMVTVLGSMYLAVLIVYFAAASKTALGSSAHSTAAFGGGVLLAMAIVAVGTGDFA